MFRLDNLKDTYPWQIAVKLPNNTQFDTIKVRVKYHRLPHEERMRLLEQFQQATNDENTALSLETDFFDAVFAGWEKGEIKDENGDVEDDAAGRGKVLSISEFRAAVTQGFFESLGGDVGKHNSLQA